MLGQFHLSNVLENQLVSSAKQNKKIHGEFKILKPTDRLHQNKLKFWLFTKTKTEAELPNRVILFLLGHDQTPLIPYAE